MYKHVGKIIKTLSQIFCLLGIIISVLIGLGKASYNPIVSIAIAVGGSLVTWLLSVAFYGMGQLIDNTNQLVAYTDIIVEKITSDNPNAPSDSNHAALDRSAVLAELRDKGIITNDEYNQKIEDWYMRS